MSTLPYFTFREHSSLDFGLYIKEKGAYKGAQRNITYTQIAGRDGDLIIDEGNYKNVNIPYKLELLNTTENSFAENARLIRNWLLLEPGYHQLWDTYDSDYFRYASFTGEADIKQELAEYGSLDITFNCKPHRYLLTGQNKVTMSANGNLTNPEEHESKPYIKVNGSGTCYVYINNKTIQLNDVSGYTEVDSEIMNCYKGTTALNNKMVGDFPIFAPGSNSISTGGGVTSLEIIPRWRTI